MANKAAQSLFSPWCYHYEYTKFKGIMAEMNILGLKTAPFLQIVPNTEGINWTNSSPSCGNFTLYLSNWPLFSILISVTTTPRLSHPQLLPKLWLPSSVLFFSVTHFLKIKSVSLICHAASRDLSLPTF